MPPETPQALAARDAASARADGGVAGRADRAVTTDASRDRQIRAEQVRALYMQLPVSVPSQIIGGTILVATMWSEVPHATLSAWLAALTGFQLTRLWLYYRWRRRASPDEDAGPWRRRWVIGAVPSGLIWGAAGIVMFVPGSPLHQAVLIVGLLGVATGSITVIATDVTAFHAFASTVVVPVLLRIAWEGSTTYLLLAAIGAVVLGAILACGRILSKALARSVAVYYQNLELIEELKAQKTIAERALQEAETANRAKTQFFAAASHDLRQPLHAMGLFAAALSQKVRDPEVRNVVESINSSVQALEALFNELLDIAKIDSGVVKPVLAAFALHDMFGRLASDFRAEAAAKGLELRVEGGGSVVNSDAVLLERILRNLLSNAVRYTAEGGVRLAAVPAGDRVRLEVRDTGMGIRPEDRDRIFEEFMQIGNPGRTSGRGMGLGLSIVRRLCALLGYEVGIDSAPGRGSTFSFEVPGGTLPARPGGGAEAGPAQADISGRLAVVIDDEAAIIEGMRVLLAGWGMDVIASLTGDDVIEAVHAAGRLPDLILADYRLGAGATGTDVIERLRRELDPEIPAALVTGSSAPELAREAAAHRCALLLKPVQPEKLRELIDATLRRGA